MAMELELHPDQSERLLEECRRALERPLSEQDIYDQAAKRRIASLIVRSATTRGENRVRSL